VSQAAGQAWDVDEVRATIEAYFEHLHGRTGRTKADTYRRLSARFPDRTPKAFEFKFANVSAVLATMGFQWLPGLLPKSNVQALLHDEVKRYLQIHPDLRPAPLVQGDPDSAAGFRG